MILQVLSLGWGFKTASPTPGVTTSFSEAKGTTHQQGAIFFLTGRREFFFFFRGKALG